MPEAVLTVLKFCFLALLYLFLARVVRVVVLELRAPAITTEVPAAPPRAGSERRDRGPRLCLVEPEERAGESFQLAEEVTVGRGGGCGIVLTDDHFVSSVHARLFRRDGDVFVEDLGSKNGTFVNGTPVTHATRLRRGDRVQFGKTIAEVER